MSLLDLWRKWATPGRPESLLSEQEAIAHFRVHATEQGRVVREPVRATLDREPVDSKDAKAGYRYVYLMRNGNTIPPQIVRVDAQDGSILAWAQGLR